MKKVIMLAACIFTISTAVNAQESSRREKGENANHGGKDHKERMTPEQRAQKNVDNLNNLVGLTEVQKVKVKELASIKIAKADDIRAKYKGQEGSKEAVKKEIDVVQKEYRRNVKALLTPEQIEKAKAKVKENMDNKKGDTSAESVIDAND